MKIWQVIILLVLIASFLPVWRIAGGTKGYNAWQMLTHGAKMHKHIGRDEAIERATEAYQLVGNPSLN